MYSTSTVPRPYLDGTSTVPRQYPRPHHDRTSTVPRPYFDRTGRVPVVRFVNFSTGDTVCVCLCARACSCMRADGGRAYYFCNRPSPVQTSSRQPAYRGWPAAAVESAAGEDAEREATVERERESEKKTHHSHTLSLPPITLFTCW